ncbi:hypothetical protein WMY93_010050 [Mugilogobius chulae]|uniref:Uncharacterized protein n=1 Tax=Mugilogobius chulae TaxID=88201 RepID=A0AAW0PBZ7_9GOBI
MDKTKRIKYTLSYTASYCTSQKGGLTPVLLLSAGPTTVRLARDVHFPSYATPVDQIETGDNGGNNDDAYFSDFIQLQARVFSDWYVTSRRRGQDGSPGPSPVLSPSNEMSGFEEVLIWILREHMACVQVHMRQIQSDFLSLMETPRQSMRLSVNAVIRAFLNNYKIQTEFLEQQVRDIETLESERREDLDGSDVASAYNDHADTVAETQVGMILLPVTLS